MPSPNLTVCEHPFQRASANDDFSICSSCGRITAPLTRAGEIELIAMLTKWAPEPGEIGDGGDDYAISRPVTIPPSRNGHEERAKWGAVTV
jgi:hypothetical protein